MQKAALKKTNILEKISVHIKVYLYIYFLLNLIITFKVSVNKALVKIYITLFSILNKYCIERYIYKVFLVTDFFVLDVGDGICCRWVYERSGDTDE